MSALTKFAAGMAAVGVLVFGSTAMAGAQDASSTGNSKLTVTDAAGHSAHFFPIVELVPALIAADSGPLLYNGGPIMPRVNIYSIFWKPATLQNGKPANMSAAYRTILTNLAADYVGHAISNNNTQYYQTISSVTTYVSGLIGTTAGNGSDEATYLDTQAYPTGGCKDPKTNTNCITDAQLQTELVRVMGVKGWTGGLDKIFVVYTASGEGSCFDAAGQYCAYSYYCAYHSDIPGTVPVVYANMPYGNPTYCQEPGTPSPNANPAADTTATAAAHEITESITDPEPDSGWVTAQGNEIGDLCAYQYGTNGYDGALANQSWNGHFYELQMMFDNHASGCEQVGP